MLWRDYWLCGFTCRHQLIDWLKVNLPKFIQLVLVVKVGTFSVVYIFVVPGDTNAHWVNPLQIILVIYIFSTKNHMVFFSRFWFFQL